MSSGKSSGARQHRTNPPHIHGTTKSTRAPPISLFSLFISPLCYLQPTRKTGRPPSNSTPSHEGQDAVDQQGHDGGAEHARHGHGDEPRQEDVPEEAPIHRFLGADPAHGHDRAHLEAAAAGGGEQREHQLQHGNNGVNLVS